MAELRTGFLKTNEPSNDPKLVKNFGPPKVDPGKTYPGLGKPVLVEGNYFHGFLDGDQPCVITYTNHEIRITNLLDDSDAIATRAKHDSLFAVSPGRQRIALARTGAIGFHIGPARKGDQAGREEITILRSAASSHWGSFLATGWAQFLDEDTLLTSNGLTRWTISTNSMDFSVHANQIMGLTPGKNFAMEPHGNRIHFIDVTSGERVGTSDGKLNVDPSAWAMTRDGRLLALKGKIFDRDYVVIRDLVRNQETVRVAVPDKVKSVAWLSDDYLLCGDWVVSLAKQAAVHKVSAVYPHTGFDGRAWTRTSRVNGGKIEPVVAHLDIFDSIPGLHQKPPMGKKALQRGDAVEFLTVFEAEPPSPEIKQRLIAAVKNNARKAGLQLVEYREDYQPKVELVPVKDNSRIEPIIKAGGMIVYQNGVAYERRIPPPRKVLRLQVSERNLGSNKSIKHDGNTLLVDDVVLDVNLGLITESLWGQHKSHFIHRVDLDAVDASGPVTPERILRYRWTMATEELETLEIPDELWAFERIRGVVASTKFDSASLQGRTAKVIVPPKRPPPAPQTKMKSGPLVKPAKRFWNVQTDPVDGDLNTGFLKQPIRLGKGRQSGIRFSGITAGQAVVSLRDRESDQQTMYRCDLRTSKILATTVVAEETRLLDFRDDAWVMATLLDDQIQIWKCGANQDEILTELSKENYGSVEGAYFVGGKHLLVHDRQSGITLHELPSGNVVYNHEFELRSCCLSWNQKYFVGLHDGKLSLVHVSDGSLAGQLQLIDGPSRSVKREVKAAFHPNGKMLAAAVESSIRLFDLRTGELIKDFLCHHRVDNLRWSGPHHLLADEALIDTNAELMAWSYSNMGSDESPDGGIYFVDDDRENVQHLAALMAPSRQVTSALQRIAAAFPLSPTESVGLKIDIQFEHPQKSQMETRIREWIEDEMAEKNLKVTPGATPCMIVTLRQRTAGRDFFVDIGGRQVEVNGDELIGSVAFKRDLSSQASPFWSKGYIVSIQDIADQLASIIGDANNEKTWLQFSELMNRVKSIDLPLFTLYSNFTGFGNSRVSIEGESIRLNSSYSSIDR